MLIARGNCSNGECIAIEPRTGELLGGQAPSVFGKAPGD